MKLTIINSCRPKQNGNLLVLVGNKKALNYELRYQYFIQSNPFGDGTLLLRIRSVYLWLWRCRKPGHSRSCRVFTWYDMYCTAATIIRQIIHTYNETTKYILPIVGYLAALITVISGICIFSNATSPSAFVAGHVITGVGFITACVATAATSSTRFSLIPENSKATGNEVPQGAFSVGQRRAMIILAIVISIIAWVWAFVLLGNSHSHPAYFVAGHVMVGLACICTSLIALVATIARQVRNDYSEKERNKWPKLVLLMGSISFVWGLFVILADSGSANGTTGYIMLGLGLVCYSISSKVILLAKIWRREFKLANRIPMIPVLTALTCLFLAAFVFELATVHADYFIPARVLVGLGAICFTLFSIVSILESGTSSK